MVTALTPDTAPRVYVLDAFGLIFQMFHGMPPMNAPDGRPTGAVFGVTRGLMDLYDHGADYLLAAFDHPDATFRSDIDPEYKAHRPPPPEDLLAQIPMIEQVLEAMRIPQLICKGFEADDIMATVALRGSDRGYRVYLCTSDKDCRQLLNSNVSIMNLRKGETLDAEGLLKDWGIRPDQVADYQALVGDSVDNVPGVPGCGAKTATKWLQQYGSLDEIIKNADALGGPKLKASFKETIANGKLDESRKLVLLRTDTPIDIDWDNWQRRDWDGPKLLELFQEFGFRGFANKVRSTLTKSGAARNAAILADIADKTPAEMPLGVIPSPPKQPRRVKGKPSLFDTIYEDGDADNPFADPPDNWSYVGYSLVNTPELLAEFLTKLQAQPRFCFDLETTGLDPITCDIVGYAFCWKAEEAYYLAVRGPATESVLDPVSTLAMLKPIFEDAKFGKTNQNIKFDELVLRSHGVMLAGLNGDPMIAHYLLHASERSHGLDDLTRQYLEHDNITIEELIGKGKKQKLMSSVPTAKVKDYAAEDADSAWRLTNIFEEQLTTHGLKGLYDDLELPLIEVLADMEHHGVRIDSAFLNKLSREMESQLATMELEIHELAGKPFNIASPTQLRTILFDEMKLPVRRKTDNTGEASTDSETLEALAALGHELPKRIIDHRQISKLKGTYVDALPALVNPKSGRVHTSFNQTVAATGRLSSSDPNLQNIPARTDMGKQIRQAFIPPDGWVLLTADYSQIELRLLAHLCGDEAMRQAFIDDRDIHSSVAAEIFKVPESEVTSQHRRVAKTVNFGVIYGISAHGLGTRLGMPRKEAEKFIDAYFARYPNVLAYQDTLLANARKVGYVATILGRRRYFDPRAIRPHTSYQQRNQAEREAINMEIQGSAADLMKKAMLNVAKRLRAENVQAKMLLSVHDELVFELPLQELQQVAKLVRDEMTNAMSVSVPLKVDVAAGANWLDVEDVTW
ncbi:DNA polymerase I [soil metagenome]